LWYSKTTQQACSDGLWPELTLLLLLLLLLLLALLVLLVLLVLLLVLPEKDERPDVTVLAWLSVHVPELPCIKDCVCINCLDCTEWCAVCICQATSFFSMICNAHIRLMRVLAKRINPFADEMAPWGQREAMCFYAL
jgi:hypothetical protein